MIDPDLPLDELKVLAAAASVDERADVAAILQLAREVALDRQGLLELRCAFLLADEDGET